MILPRDGQVSFYSRQPRGKGGGKKRVRVYGPKSKLFRWRPLPGGLIENQGGDRGKGGGKKRVRVYGPKSKLCRWRPLPGGLIENQGGDRGVGTVQGGSMGLRVTQLI